MVLNVLFVLQAASQNEEEAQAQNDGIVNVKERPEERYLRFLSNIQSAVQLFQLTMTGVSSLLAIMPFYTVRQCSPLKNFLERLEKLPFLKMAFVLGSYNTESNNPIIQ